MFEKNISLRFLRFLSVDDTSSRGFKRTTKLLTKVLLRDGKRERESGTSSSSSSSQTCAREEQRGAEKEKKRDDDAMETFLILVFLNSTRFSRQHIIPFATI